MIPYFLNIFNKVFPILRIIFLVYILIVENANIKN